MPLGRHRALLITIAALATTLGASAFLHAVRAGAPCDPPASAPPNAPSGYDCLLSISTFDALQLNDPSGAVTLAFLDDPTAPASPPRVVRLGVAAASPQPAGTRTPAPSDPAPAPPGSRPPSGSGTPGSIPQGTRPPAGSASGAGAMFTPATPLSGVFVSVWAKFAPDWVTDPTLLDVGLRLATSTGEATLTLGTTGPSGAQRGLMLGTTALNPNQGATLAISADTWMRWEIQVEPAAGGARVRWWVNGVLSGDHTDITAWSTDPPTLLSLGWFARARLSVFRPWLVAVDELYVGGKGTDDAIVVTDNIVPASYGGSTDRETMVLVDARQSPTPAACDTNLVMHGVGPFRFPNLRTSSDCDKLRTTDFVDAIAVFSAGNGFALREGRLWDDGVGHVETVRLGPPASLPLRVWPVEETYDWTGFGGVVHTEDVATLAKNQVLQALQSFDDNLTGITFDASYWPDGGTPDRVDARAKVGSTCGGAGWNPPAPYWQSGAINVYFVLPGPSVPWNLAAQNCDSQGDRLHSGGVVFVYLRGVVAAATLSHELGHVMALQHVANNVADKSCYSSGTVDTGNLMYALMVAELKRFTLGQAFRINVDDRSAATVLRTPSLATRRCSMWCYVANDGVCPSVLFE